MNPATAALLVQGITALLAAIPGIIQAIQGMDAPEEDKAALIARIKVAQSGLPIWE
jgi:hypothetical protein